MSGITARRNPGHLHGSEVGRIRNEVAGRTAGRGSERYVGHTNHGLRNPTLIRVYLASNFLFKHLELSNILDSIDKKVVSYHQPQPYSNWCLHMRSQDP